ASGGTAEMPHGDQFGDDPGAAYEERRRALLSAGPANGALDRDWMMPVGAMSGALMAQIAFMGHGTHGVGGRKATGQDTAVPPGLVTECFEVVTPMDAMLRMPGVCGPPVSVAEDAPLQDKLVAFLGRNP